MCIGPTIRIGRESWCLPYAGFLLYISLQSGANMYSSLFQNDNGSSKNNDILAQRAT